MALLNILLYLTHVFLTCRALILTIVDWLMLLFVRPRWVSSSMKKHVLPVMSQFTHDTNLCFKKNPNHVGVVILEDKIVFSDIANIIIWCMTLGVSCVSIYDRSGICKQKRNLLQSTLEEQKQRLLKDRSGQYHANFRRRYDPPSEVNITSVHNCHIEVSILSMEDGMPDLVKTAQHLSTAVMGGHCSLDDINPTYVNSLLQAKHGYLDPDLILKFGKVDSLLGFMPWQTRLSEILYLQTHHKIDYRSFHKALMFFSSKEQRFGK